MKQDDQDKARLRAAAEARLLALRKKNSWVAPASSADQMRRLHEIQVHQIELELQNETLQQTQIALEESRDRYADLYEFAPVGYLTLGAEGLIEEINLSGEALLGDARGNLLQRRFSQFICAEDRARCQTHFGTVLKQEEKCGCQLVLQRPDGTRIDVYADCLRMLRDGQTATVRMVLSDITARKAADAQARLHSILLNAVGQAVIATDPDGTIRFFNLAAERLYGWPAAEALGRNSVDVTVPDVSRAQAVELMTSLRSGQAWSGDFMVTHRNGSIFPANVHVTPVCDDQGKVTSIIGVSSDITERRKNEQALLQSKHLLELTMQMSNTAGWDIDLVDQTLHRTRGHDRIFGYDAPLPTWNLDTFFDHVLAEDRPEVERQFRQASATHGDWNLQCRIRRADGEVRWIAAAGGHQRDDHGVARRMSGIVRDITDAMRLEQSMHLQNEELMRARSVAEKANLAKSDFLSSMSHELRTPLNAILGFAQLMESGTPTPTPKQQKDIEQILGAGWYLLELINEILDLALIESGRATLSREAVSLGEVLSECWAMIEPQAQKRNIVVTFPAFDNPYHVNADRTRVKQVLINLLYNAIKYNTAGGTVKIDLDHVPPNSIRVSIRDSGAGVPPERLAELFQPFNRLGRELGTEEGTGIGLVVTKRLVEMMGGSIGVDSAVGVGSVFWIELALTAPPLTAIQRSAHAALARPPLAQGEPQRTVLYVEDNPANLALVEDIVARLPHLRLISAADGDLGIEFTRAYLPAVVLMDINLPGISGLEAMKILRADPETAHIPIIALSANALPHDVVRGMQAGFFRYLTKPIKLAEFIDALDAALIFAPKPEPEPES